MPVQDYRYIIVGGGLAGGSAVDGIREIDKDGPILLVAEEASLPYNRPPLSKDLWLGKGKVADIFVHDEEFYRTNGVDLALANSVSAIEPAAHTVRLADGRAYGYQKLLLATGGAPKRLSVPGGDLPDLIHYRTLADFTSLHGRCEAGLSAVVIGGGFIGSEMAAALNSNQLLVTMIFPEPYLVQRVFPEGLGRALQGQFRERGVDVLAEDAPVSIEKTVDGFVTTTRNSNRIASDFVIVGAASPPVWS